MVASAGPSQLPTSVAVPVKLMRPSGQRGAGRGASAGGCCAEASRLAATAAVNSIGATILMPASSLRAGVLWLLPGQRLTARRSRSEHFARALARNAARVRMVAAIAGEPAFDIDRLADREAVLLPARLLQHVRRAHLEAPVRDLARFVLHVDEDVHVRVRPLETRHYARHLDRLVGVELRAERVVREARAGSRCQQHRRERGNET